MVTEARVTPIHDAIAEGHKVWHQGVMLRAKDVSRFAGLQEDELQRARQDLYRSVAIETLMTRAEIDARYVYKEEGPFSRKWEDGGIGEDGEPERIPVPLERAEYWGYLLRLGPRRHPQKGAVYVVRQPIEGEQFSVEGMMRALRAVDVAHLGQSPIRLRLSHGHFADYVNAMLDVVPRYGLPGLIRNPRVSDELLTAVQFCGISIAPLPRVPAMTLCAVYPLPGTED